MIAIVNNNSIFTTQCSEKIISEIKILKHKT